MIRLTAFSHDVDLLAAESEAVERQRLYCRRLHLSQTFLIRTKRAARDTRHDDLLSALPCRSPHWAAYPFVAAWRAVTEVRGRCHLVTAQDAFLSALPAAILAALWHRPLIIGVFSDEIDNPELARERPCYALLNRLAKHLLARAAVIRTDSAEMATKLQRLGFARARFIPFLIPRQEDFLAVRHLPGNGALRLLAIVRLETQKNLGLALESVAALAATTPVRLDVVGDGSQRAALEAQVAALGIAALVRFHGSRPFNELPGHLATADVVILTSHHETAARVLVLAALAGVPVVTTATTGSAEVVEDGHTGFIVPLGDQTTLVERLARLAADPALRHRLGTMARSSAIARFSRIRVLAGLAAMYRGVK